MPMVIWSSETSYPTLIINTTVVCDEVSHICNDIRIVNGGKLTITADITRGITSSITVEDGGELIIDGGSITRGSVVVKSNGTMSITGGGELLLNDSNNFKVEQGGIYYQLFGKIQIID